MWVWSLGWEDSVEKGSATHSSISTWRSPWTEEPGGLPSIGSQRVRHHWSDLASKDNFMLYLFCYWARACVPAVQKAKSNSRYLQQSQGLFAEHSCSKELNPLLAFRQVFLMTVLEERAIGGVISSRIFFWLVGCEITGWCIETLSYLPSGCNPSEV